MEQKQVAKQMVQFNKTVFDNSFTAMIALQNQTDKVVMSFLEKAAWMPPEGKKAISDWIASYKKGCEDFKKTADDSYKKVADYFSQAEKS